MRRDVYLFFSLFFSLFNKKNKFITRQLFFSSYLPKYKNWQIKSSLEKKFIQISIFLEILLRFRIYRDYSNFIKPFILSSIEFFNFIETLIFLFSWVLRFFIFLSSGTFTFLNTETFYLVKFWNCLFRKVLKFSILLSIEILILSSTKIFILLSTKIFILLSSEIFILSSTEIFILSTTEIFIFLSSEIFVLLSIGIFSLLR